ncbi:uDP-N-acetylmuramate--L-alanine ligase [Clostridium sp. CAG:762]|nr:uDP-N-acetylmuramate--L-alanine ligase [Clostridium sp. CAG:762]
MKYYFVGIKGTGMSGLACILNDLGNTVIGYDDYKEHKFTENELELRNIKIYNDSSYQLTNEIVVYSAALDENHVELQRAKEKNLKILKYNIIGCSYLIGDGTGKSNKESDYFVIEACEYKRHFLAYHPYMSVITNIELDHTDYYKDINDMVDAYQSLLNNTKFKTVLCGDDKLVRKLTTHIDTMYYGLNDNNDIIAKNISYYKDYTCFDVYINDIFYGNIKIKLAGNHMVLNTLAVIGICNNLGLNKYDVIEQLETFTGAKRRYQIKEIENTIIIDDYAHHPTEIKATIEATRNKYKYKKIIALFMPNTYSRVKDFYKAFADSLNKADYVYLFDIAKGRENPNDFKGISSKLILDNLNNAEMITLNDEQKLLKHKGDVLLFMSCQNIYIIEEKLERLLGDKVGKEN